MLKNVEFCKFYADDITLQMNALRYFDGVMMSTSKVTFEPTVIQKKRGIYLRAIQTKDMSS